MNKLKTHWPVPVILIAWLLIVLAVRWIDRTYLDALSTGLSALFFTCILLPLLFLIAGVWYGRKCETPKKWLLVPLAGLLDLLVPVASVKEPDLTAIWWIVLFGAMSALIGLAIGNLLRKRSRR